MKPNLKFLEKVGKGCVYPVSNYSMRGGRKDRFVGGEVTARQHAEEGYIKIYWPPNCMSAGTVVLTKKGRTLLAASGLEAKGGK